MLTAISCFCKGKIVIIPPSLTLKLLDVQKCLPSKNIKIILERDQKQLFKSENTYEEIEMEPAEFFLNKKFNVALVLLKKSLKFFEFLTPVCLEKSVKDKPYCSDLSHDQRKETCYRDYVYSGCATSGGWATALKQRKQKCFTNTFGQDILK